MKKRAMCLLLALLMASTLLTGCAEAIQIEHNSVPMGEGPEGALTAISAEAEQAAADEAAKKAAEAEEAARRAEEEAAAAEAAKRAAEEEAARLQAEEIARQQAEEAARQQAEAEEIARQQAEAEEAARQQAEADQAAAQQAEADQAAAQQAAGQPAADMGMGFEEPSFEEPSLAEPSADVPAQIGLEEPMAVSEPTEEPEPAISYVELECTNGSSFEGWSKFSVTLTDGKLPTAGFDNWYLPERAGYRFAGWYKQKCGESGTDIAGKTAVHGGDDVSDVSTLYSGWVRIIVLDAGPGNFWEGQVKDNNYTRTVDLTANCLPTQQYDKDNADGTEKMPIDPVYSIDSKNSSVKFVGWYSEKSKVIEADGSDHWELSIEPSGTQYKPGDAIPEGITTLYAGYKLEGKPLQEVTYYLDWNGINGLWGHNLTCTRSYAAGGYELTAGDLLVRYLNWGDSLVNGQTVTDNVDSYTTKEALAGYWAGRSFDGYTFKGWADSADAKEPNVWPGTQVKNGQSIYALWEKDGQSSESFDRSDPGAGPLEFTQILGNLDTSKSGSVHADKGASFALELHRSPVRANVSRITWHIGASMTKDNASIVDVLTTSVVSHDVTVDPNSGAAETYEFVFEDLGRLVVTARGYSLTITDTDGKVSSVTVSADAASEDNDGQPITVHTNADAKISFYHNWNEGTKLGGEATCTTGVETQYECKTCHITKIVEGYPLGHVYDSRSEKGVNVYEEPTCTEPGKKHLVCLRCNEENTDYEYSVPALGHDWQLDADKPAEIVDCRHTTYYDKCTRCGEERSRQEWAYNNEGHSWGDWVVTREADYLNAGQQRRYCSICRSYDYEQIPVKPVMEVSYSGFFSVGANSQKQIVAVDGAKYCADSSGYAVAGWQTVSGQKYYFNTSSGAMTTGWQTISGQKYYMNADGAVTTGWQTISGQKYYMNADGAVTTGWQNIGGRKYYMNASGAVTTGWQTVGSQKFYMGADGAVQTGWQTISGRKYYFDGNGVMGTNWQTIGGKRYYMGTDGAVRTGVQTISGKRYNFDANGCAAGGSVKVSGKLYIFNADGSQVTGSGWKTVSGRKYYLNGDGSAKTGWQTISKKKYYFDGNNGSMATGGVKISGKTYVFNANGTQVTGKGWKTVSGKKYYLNSNGTAKTGLQTISKKRYYFGSDGSMQKGWQTISGKRYYFNSNGTANKGWKTISGQKYYFHSNGYAKTGWQTISGKKYYFNSSGQMQKGWQTIGGKRYYFKSNGQMVKGLQTISGKKYYFSSSGVMKVNGWQKVSGKKYYFGSDGAALKGWQTIGGKTYYFKSNCQMATGKVKIGGKTYTFKSDGTLK